MMRRPQLIHVMAALAMLSAAACNRAETQEQTQRAAAEVKTAAARAGDKLADGWLTTRIQAQYFADDEVKARYIDVNTSDGVVTIKGFVETWRRSPLRCTSWASTRPVAAVALRRGPRCARARRCRSGLRGSRSGRTRRYGNERVDTDHPEAQSHLRMAWPQQGVSVHNGPSVNSQDAR
jgi:hypothetical protein